MENMHFSLDGYFYFLYQLCICFFKKGIIRILFKNPIIPTSWASPSL